MINLRFSSYATLNPKNNMKASTLFTPLPVGPWPDAACLQLAVMISINAVSCASFISGDVKNNEILTNVQLYLKQQWVLIGYNAKGRSRGEKRFSFLGTQTSSLRISAKCLIILTHITAVCIYCSIYQHLNSYVTTAYSVKSREPRVFSQVNLNYVIRASNLFHSSKYFCETVANIAVHKIYKN